MIHTVDKNHDHHRAVYIAGRRVVRRSSSSLVFRTLIGLLLALFGPGWGDVELFEDLALGVGEAVQA